MTPSEIVERAGLDPVALVEHPIDPLNRNGIDPRTGLDQGPAGILARLDDMDVDAMIDRVEAESLPMPLDEWFEYH